MSCIEVRNSAKLDRLEAIRGILIVGASCSGKATLIRHLRTMLLPEGFACFPPRYTTRPPRNDDDPTLTTTVSRSELDALEAEGRLAVRWTKRLGCFEDDYAFRSGSWPFHIYAANDDLVLNPRNRIRNEEFIMGLLISEVHTDEPMRQEWLKARESSGATRTHEFEEHKKQSASAVQEISDMRIYNEPNAALAVAKEVAQFVKQLVLVLSCSRSF